MQPTYDELVQLCYALDATLSQLSAAAGGEPIALVAKHSVSLHFKDALPSDYVQQLHTSVQLIKQHIPGVTQL